MLADGRHDVAPLIAHRFPLEQAEEAYKLVVSGANPLAILLKYRGESKSSSAELRHRTVSLVRPLEPSAPPVDAVVVGVIGSGNYATQVLIPAFKETRAVLKSVASQAGVSATHAGKKYGFENSTGQCRV